MTTDTNDTTAGLSATVLEEWVRPGSRIDRARQPRAKDVLRDMAVDFGVCVRPRLTRRIVVATGETSIVEQNCKNTRAKVCPSCASRARALRAADCREGWHLTEEPDMAPRQASSAQKQLMKDRAEVTAARQDAAEEGDHELVAVLDQSLEEIDEAIAVAKVRGTVAPKKTRRRRKSTRRRDDVPDLPRRPSTGSTLGRVYTDPKTGKEYRPSLFVTLTLPSYGRVDSEDGTPLHPGSYDYTRAARDAIHFGKLLDRWTQHLRRVAGYDAQYFAAVEPQRRAAPHAHYAIRGTLPRAVVKELTAATYANVWWPSVETVYYAGTRLPVWDGDASGFVDPDTRQALVTWEDALDEVDADKTAPPMHSIRFGTQVDVKGVLAGSEDAERAIGYLVKYLTKDLGEDLGDADTEDGDQGDEPDSISRRPALADRKASAARRADHVARLVEALRFEPCAPTCANWLRYGVQPQDARPGMRPGCCRGKAHKPSHLGYGGRRVLVSRKWSGKDLADHRHDRKAHVLAILAKSNASADGPDAADEGGVSATEAAPSTGAESGVIWEPAKPSDPDVAPPQMRLMRRIADHVRRRDEYQRARDDPGSASVLVQQVPLDSTATSAA